MTHHTDQDRAWEMIEQIGMCMLVTYDGSGDQLRARPMDAHAAREEDAIYFLTDVRSHKDDEVEINDNVCLTFADNGGWRFVSVTGTANVLDDRRKVHELWSPENKAFLGRQGRSQYPRAEGASLAGGILGQPRQDRGHGQDGDRRHHRLETLARRKPQGRALNGPAPTDIKDRIST